MKICLITPAPPGSRKGNRITSLRWARILRGLGHRVVLEQEYTGQRCDILVALHARRSFASIERFHRQCPHAPLVVVMTGTDLYHDIHRSRQAQKSLELASRLVLLQRHGIAELPAAVRHKARVIYQSARPPRSAAQPRKRVFEVCVAGHLRPVKDPFRTALASRALPASSRIRVVHIGAALSGAMARRARQEMARNPRYRWLGELPRWLAVQAIRRSRLLVVSSKLEGAPNVASEALAAGVPILSSHISGMIGILGTDYSGYFTPGNTQELTTLLGRCESQPKFLDTLRRQCRQVRRLVDPRQESRCWKKLLRELTHDGG